MAYQHVVLMLSSRRLLSVKVVAQVSRLKREISTEQLQTLYSACAGLPALVATGAQDGIVPRAQVQIPCVHAHHAFWCSCIKWAFGTWQVWNKALVTCLCVFHRPGRLLQTLALRGRRKAAPCTWRAYLIVAT